jgi:hypothetical protein
MEEWSVVLGLEPGYAFSMRRRFALALALAGLAWQSGIDSLGAQARNQPDGDPVRVRYSEGSLHGFLELRNDKGALIAHGDLLQVAGDSGIESRMVLRFLDQSFMEETVRFTQHLVFVMESYHLVQRGPAFDFDLDASLSRDGHYLVKSLAHKKGAKEEHDDGRLDLPTDVYNGLPIVVTKNLPPGDSATVHIVAFTPKPTVIGLGIGYMGTDTVLVGNDPEPAARYVLEPRLGALKAFFAKMFGKLPPDSHIWIDTEEVPVLVRFEGPLFMGPVWRLSLATPTWPEPAAGASP